MTAGTDAASLAKEEFEDLESTKPTVLVMTCFWVFLGAAIRSLPLSIQSHIPCTVFVLFAKLFHTNEYMFHKVCFCQVLIVAFPGVLMSAVMVASSWCVLCQIALAGTRAWCSEQCTLPPIVSELAA